MYLHIVRICLSLCCKDKIHGTGIEINVKENGLMRRNKIHRCSDLVSSEGKFRMRFIFMVGTETISKCEA